MNENKVNQTPEEIETTETTPETMPAPVEHTAPATVSAYEIGTASTAPVYTTLDVSTTDGKKKLFKIKNHPDHVLSDFINKPIKIKDIYVDVNPRLNKDPNSENCGCYEDKPRTVLIDVNGESYVSGVSIGIFTAVKEIIRTFGDPSTWEEPLEVIPVTVHTPKGNMLSLDIV